MTLNDGVVTFAEPYRNGLAHGKAKQWSYDGELIGTYTMTHGTGLDFWHAKITGATDRVYLSEARHIKEGNGTVLNGGSMRIRRVFTGEHHFSGEFAARIAKKMEQLSAV